MSYKGYKQTKEHKRNISKANKGHKVWNKGLTKETDERVAKYINKNIGKKRSNSQRKRISDGHKGQKAWNKNLIKETDARIKGKFTKEQEQQICDDYFSEEKPSVAILAKKWNCNDLTIRGIILRNGYVLRTISEANKGKPGYWKNKFLYEKTKRKISESTTLRIQTHPGPFKNTKPELKMKVILNELSIPFEHQFRLGNHLYDFHILNTNILIEVDGDYYHGNPKKFGKLNKYQLKQKEKDLKNGQLAKDNNYILLRFWENDILNNSEKVIKHIKGNING